MEERDLYDFEPQPLLIVISGPSGVGKDSLIQRLKERGWPSRFDWPASFNEE